MDIGSHILFGRALATAPKISRRNIFLITFFSYLPDLPQTFTYIYLGFVNSRPYWFPLNSDWEGFRELYPFWIALWEIPHSLLFVFFVVFPVVYFLRLPKMALYAYLIHVIVDVFTHTGEWGSRIFYPFSYQINGFTDAWSWPLSHMAISWTILVVIIITAQYAFRKKMISLDYDRWFAPFSQKKI